MDFNPKRAAWKQFPAALLGLNTREPLDIFVFNRKRRSLKALVGLKVKEFKLNNYVIAKGAWPTVSSVSGHCRLIARRRQCHCWTCDMLHPFAWSHHTKWNIWWSDEHLRCLPLQRSPRCWHCPWGAESDGLPPWSSSGWCWRSRWGRGTARRYCCSAAPVLQQVLQKPNVYLSI